MIDFVRFERPKSNESLNVGRYGQIYQRLEIRYIALVVYRRVFLAEASL